MNYLNRHSWEDAKSQTLISYLLKKYIRNDFIKPKTYCEWIVESDCAFAELYLSAATYFGMIAEYDLSDKAANKGLTCGKYLYTTNEYMQNSLEKQKADTLRYRTKKPYWPIGDIFWSLGMPYPRTAIEQINNRLCQQERFTYERTLLSNHN